MAEQATAGAAEAEARIDARRWVDPGRCSCVGRRGGTICRNDTKRHATRTNDTNGVRHVALDIAVRSGGTLQPTFAVGLAHGISHVESKLNLKCFKICIQTIFKHLNNLNTNYLNLNLIIISVICII